MDERSSSPNTLAKTIQNRDGHFPRNASIGDRLAVFQASGSRSRDILTAFDQVTLDHDTQDVRRGVFGGFELLGLAKARL